MAEQEKGPWVITEQQLRGLAQEALDGADYAFLCTVAEALYGDEEAREHCARVMG